MAYRCCDNAGMETPDITKAQIIALVQALLAVIVAFGVPLSDRQEAAILGLAGAIAIVLPLADAIIRNGRSRIYAAHVATQPDED
jgi:multisubunit Na+/H+ antiporter MnhB subunit